MSLMVNFQQVSHQTLPLFVMNLPLHITSVICCYEWNQMLLLADATKVLLFFTKVSPEVPLNKLLLLYNDHSFSSSVCSLFLLP